MLNAENRGPMPNRPTPPRSAGSGLFWAQSAHLAKSAKQKRGQVIENKRSGEIADFAPSMISMAYDGGAKPFVSLGEMLLSPLLSSSTPERKGETQSSLISRAEARLSAFKL